MGNTTISAADWIKFTAATVEQVSDEPGAPSAHPGLPSDVVAIARLDLETACARLEQVREMLRGIVALFYSDHVMAHFADGRPVLERLQMCDGRQYLQAGHPDPVQDQPREIRTVTTRNGIKKRIVVSAPGHLDAVSEFPGCESPSWAADW